MTPSPAQGNWRWTSRKETGLLGEEGRSRGPAELRGGERRAEGGDLINANAPGTWSLGGTCACVGDFGVASVVKVTLTQGSWPWPPGLEGAGVILHRRVQPRW